jgi:hypothetical protein
MRNQSEIRGIISNKEVLTNFKGIINQAIPKKLNLEINPRNR